MIALLGQAHGFEAFCWIEVDVPRHDPAAFERPYMSHGLGDPDAALLADAAKLDSGHDLVAGVHKAPGDVVTLAEQCEDLPPRFAKALVALERALGPEERLALVDLNSRVEERQQLGTGQSLRLGEEFS